VLNLLGEYDCKLDAKGRMMLPKKLQKQLEGQLSDGFVVNRDSSVQALVLYPMSTWRKEVEMMSRLNMHKRRNKEYVRRFNNGATDLQLDGQGRLLLPSNLLAHTGAKKEVVLLGLNDRIELWSKAEYKKMLNEDIDLGDLEEEVMGDIDPDFD